MHCSISITVDSEEGIHDAESPEFLSSFSGIIFIESNSTLSQTDYNSTCRLVGTESTETHRWARRIASAFMLIIHSQVRRHLEERHETLVGKVVGCKRSVAKIGVK